jgi:hypothetical protein
MEQLYGSLQTPTEGGDASKGVDVAQMHRAFQKLLETVGNAALTLAHTRAVDAMHKAALSMVEAKTLETVVASAIEASRAAADAAVASASTDRISTAATAMLPLSSPLTAGGTAISSPTGKATTAGLSTAAASASGGGDDKRVRLSGDMVKMLEAAVEGAVASVTECRDSVHAFVRLYGQLLASREAAGVLPAAQPPPAAQRLMAGEAALSLQDSRLANAKKRYHLMDLRPLPAEATSAYPQEPRDFSGSGPAPQLLDATSQPTQRAVAAVQDAGVKIIHADQVRPMVDVSTAGADSPSLKHYTLMVDAADAAVHHTELVVAAAVQAQLDAIANKDRASREQKWNEAVGQLMAVVASVDALSARNRADKVPNDAGTVALREAAAAVNEADQIVLRVPKDENGATYIDSVAPGDFIALAAATQRARAAAAAASSGMDRRPELAAVSQKLREASAAHRETSDRLKAAKAAVDGAGTVSTADQPLTAKAIQAVHDAIETAAKAGTEATTQVTACKAALQRDALNGTTEHVDLLARLADANSQVCSRVQCVCFAASFSYQLCFLCLFSTPHLLLTPLHGPLSSYLQRTATTNARASTLWR